MVGPLLVAVALLAVNFTHAVVYNGVEYVAFKTPRSLATAGKLRFHKVVSIAILYIILYLYYVRDH